MKPQTKGSMSTLGVWLGTWQLELASRRVTTEIDSPVVGLIELIHDEEAALIEAPEKGLKLIFPSAVFEDP